MNGLNKVMLLGSLGADPELKVLPSGSAVLRLRIATNETYLDRNNTRQERTEWHSVALFGKRAEALAKLLRKGETVCVEGSLHTSSYEKNGEKRYSTEVNAREVFLCGGRRNEEPRDAAPRVESRRQRSPAPEPPADPDWVTSNDDGEFGF